MLNSLSTAHQHDVRVDVLSRVRVGADGQHLGLRAQAGDHLGLQQRE